MSQVLYERGFININKVSHPHSMPYSKKGKKTHYDTNGELTEVEKYLPHHLLSKCTDFMNEESDLEHLSSDLSTSTSTVTFTFTTNFHCEISGEGIEYAWGLSKKYYCQIPYREKRSFQQFVSCVQTSLSKNTSVWASTFPKNPDPICLGIIIKQGWMWS